MSRPQLSQDEFKVYLLIYAAYADYEFHPKEERFIIEYSSRGLFDKMHDLYQENTDYNSLQLVLRHKRDYLQDARSKSKMHETILNLFKVDGDYSRGEKTFLEFLDKLTETDAIS